MVGRVVVSVVEDDEVSVDMIGDGRNKIQRGRGEYVGHENHGMAE